MGIYNRNCQIIDGKIINNDTIVYSLQSIIADCETGKSMGYRFSDGRGEFLDIPLESAKNYFKGVNNLEEFEKAVEDKGAIFRQGLAPWFPKIVLKGRILFATSNKKVLVNKHYLENSKITGLHNYITIKNPFFVVRVKGNETTLLNMAMLSKIVYSSDFIKTLHITSVFNFEPLYTEVASFIVKTELFDLFDDKTATAMINEFLNDHLLDREIYFDILKRSSGTYVRFIARYYMDCDNPYKSTNILAYKEEAFSDVLCWSGDEHDPIFWSYSNSELFTLYGKANMKHRVYSDDFLRFISHNSSTNLRIPNKFYGVFSRLYLAYNSLQEYYLVDETSLKCDLIGNMVKEISGAIEDVVSLNQFLSHIVDKDAKTQTSWTSEYRERGHIGYTIQVKFKRAPHLPFDELDEFKKCFEILAGNKFVEQCAPEYDIINDANGYTSFSVSLGLEASKFSL